MSTNLSSLYRTGDASQSVLSVRIDDKLDFRKCLKQNFQLYSQTEYMM